MPRGTFLTVLSLSGTDKILTRKTEKKKETKKKVDSEAKNEVINSHSQEKERHGYSGL